MKNGKEKETSMAAAAGNDLPVPDAGHRAITSACPDVPLHGIPDFHHVEEEGDHVRMASMVMDKDVHGRVNTGTGEQPSNSGGSRFATHSGEEE